MVIYKKTNIDKNHMGDNSLWKTESLWDEAACAEKCFEMEGCVGFALWPRDSPYVGCYPKSSTAGGISSAIGGHFGSGVTSGVLCDGSTSTDVMPDGGETYTKGKSFLNSFCRLLTLVIKTEIETQIDNFAYITAYFPLTLPNFFLLARKFVNSYFVYVLVVDL